MRGLYVRDADGIFSAYRSSADPSLHHFDWQKAEVCLERAVQLGGVAEGTARMVAKRSSLGEYPANAADGRSHVDALSSALAAFGKAARKAIEQANELGDLDTADVFTEVSRGVDKWLWFVEAHLQAER